MGHFGSGLGPEFVRIGHIGDALVSRRSEIGQILGTLPVEFWFLAKISGNPVGLGDFKKGKFLAKRAKMPFFSEKRGLKADPCRDFAVLGDWQRNPGSC